MSHHLDTPLAGRNGQLFIDDLYVFPGQDSTVLVMDVNSNITGVYAQPGFHPEARYESKVHFDDAEYETLTYRESFGEPDSGGRQSLRRQINRAGNPMMWPIFWPGDTDFSNPANVRHPAEDFAADGGHIAGQVAVVVAASGTSDDPEGYGETVARQLLPDILPYVVGTPATFGFAGRNGRTQADNAPEAMMSLVTGTAVPSGLRPSVSGQVRRSDFPYAVPV